MKSLHTGGPWNAKVFFSGVGYYSLTRLCSGIEDSFPFIPDLDFSSTVVQIAEPVMLGNNAGRG